MCSPTALVGGAAIGIDAIGSYYNNRRERANQQAAQAYQDLIFQENARVATEAARISFSQIQRRIIQEDQATTRTLNEAARRAREVRASATVAAAEGGVGGGSIDALLNDYLLREGEFRSATLTNARMRNQQLALASEEVQANLQGRILSRLPQPVPGPDNAGDFFNFLGSTSRTLLSI